ncbi:MAG TPA: glycosyltransferase [Verrucomicrobiales bacterium]|nr:glycosyltransferase [Verrucomicrobiales bacterium]
MTETTVNEQLGNVGELTEEEAFELAEALKKQLEHQRVPESDHESLRLMVAGLGDQRGALRLTFAQSLGSIGEAALPILCEALKNNPNVLIRRASAKTLNLIGSRRALPNLIEAFQSDPDPVVQGSSAGAMATIGIPAIESLLSLLKSNQCTAFQIGLINLSLSFIGSKAPDAFNRAIKSENPEIRIAAITVLSEQIQSGTNPRARDLLVNALDDQNSEVRAEAATMVGKLLEPEDSAAQLIQLLRDNNQQVRKNTALALMKMEATSAVKHLEEALADEQDDQVRAVMIVACRQLYLTSESN